MKISKISVLITVFLLIITVFQGCAEETGSATVVVTDTAHNSEQVKVSSAAAEETSTPRPENNDHAAILSEQAGKAPILDNGETLEEIAAFLNMSEDELLNNYDDKIKCYRWDNDYKEYLYNGMGVNLVCYGKDDEDYIVKYIELNRDKIDFNGVKSSMNFKEVKELLGGTATLEFEDGLPGLKTYELRYKFNNIRLRIYSWDKDGNGGIYISVVDAYLPEYRPIRITPEQISHYFKLTRDELIGELGEGEIPLYKENCIEYQQYGASFEYSKQGPLLYSVWFDANYQINDLKEGVSMDEVLKKMGKKKVIESQTSEDGPIYVVTYKFDNYIHEIDYLAIEGPYTMWTFKNKDYDYEY